MMFTMTKKTCGNITVELLNIAVKYVHASIADHQDHIQLVHSLSCCIMLLLECCCYASKLIYMLQFWLAVTSSPDL